MERGRIELDLQRVEAEVLEKWVGCLAEAMGSRDGRVLINDTEYGVEPSDVLALRRVLRKLGAAGANE
jgi:hypothetical protein